LSIGKRIEEVIEAEKSQAIFNKKTGWNTGDLKGIRDNPNRSVGFDKLKSILDAYPSVSAEWLMRGEGDMQRVGSDGNNINVQLANGHGNTQQYTVSDVAHLQALLAEKERLIQVLLEKK
jgi:hypothetical protein